MEQHRVRSRRIAVAVGAAALTVALAAPVALAGDPQTAVARPASDAAQAETAAVSYPYAPWLTDEAFYLKMFNCTRTGGWVQSNGSCSGYGSGKYSAYVRPLTRSPGISDRATRPYAKLLAIKSLCGHYYDGDTRSRLLGAGFSGSAWGENLACRTGMSTRGTVIWAHRVFQSEKSSNGAHWKNIKNTRYTYIGIGVWKYGDRVRLVTDFYRP
ncbi:MAG TPA: CAP domain-containing protein [Candidatus Limnocylindrales bacterium]|jgi:hypothetical protein